MACGFHPLDEVVPGIETAFRGRETAVPTNPSLGVGLSGNDGDGWALEAGLRVLRQAIVRPAEHVAGMLQLPEGAGVVEIERLRAVDGKPAWLAMSYFPASLCAGLAERDLTSQSAYRLLEEEFGLRPGRVRFAIGSSNASGRVARLLEVEPGTAVGAIERELFLDDGTPLEYLNAYIRGDRFKLSLEGRRRASTSSFLFR